MNRILRSGVPLLGAFFSAILFCGAVSMPARAGEVGFIEEFSLEKDRANALRLLVPGTEDHFYYTCLSLQHAERFKDVKPVVDQWVQRYGYTPRVREILNRQALLTYETSPTETLRYLREQLGLNYGHERVVPGAKPNLPKALDPNSYSRKAMQDHALAHFSNLDGFEDSALTWLATEKLDPDRRRAFLARLQRPDVPNLAKMVADDLNHEHSGGFGSLNAHRILLKSQMDELLKPELDGVLKVRGRLIHDGNFVYQYLTRLRPSDDFDWKNNPEELKSYLERLQKFVETLPPTFNSLKAHVLYHELQRERQLGKYTKAKVVAYVKIPRHMPYVNPKYLETAPDRNNPCDLNANFQPYTGLDPIGNDEPLVRDMLATFFVDDADTKEFDPYVGDLYLRYLFAETKLLHGRGDAQRWTALLPPEMYQQIKDRVDIDFFPTNRNVYASSDTVGLDLWVKNAEKLIVKVFEINTAGYYRTRLSEVETSINLDGLVPNEEKVYTYEEGPLRRMKRHFEFPSLNKAGVYVIDFIGNGKSSRAVIHKGRLHFIAKNSMLGHVLTVYDENGKKLNDANVWMAGRDYPAEKDGTIRIPYSSQATTTQKIVLGHKGLSTLEQMIHWQETYELRSGLYVDREQLLTRNKATLVVRPGLYIAGQPTSVKVLEEVRVTLASVDLDGIRATKEFSDVKLYEDRETEIDFQVPQRLSNITFTLHAKVQNLATGQKQDLAVTESYSVNQIDPTDKIEDLHLTRLGERFYLEIFGRTGEERKDRPVQLQVKHQDFRHAPHFSLQTDEQGRIDLGPLTGVAQITATGPEGTSHTWRIPRDETTLPGVVHAAAGDTIELPYLGSLENPDRGEMSLIEMRAGNFVSDQLAKTKIVGGMVQIDKLDAGDYELLFKSTGQRVLIRVVAGAKADGNVTGAYRTAQLARLAPLQIASIETTDSHLKVQLKNTTKLTRVHVLATRFLPNHGIFGQLSKVRDAELEARLRAKPKSLYLSGRSIGDEYQYILDRRLVKRYPGNMLERPGLLLNPWAIRDTSTSIQEAQQGAEFDRLAREEPAAMAPAASMPMQGDMAQPPNDAAFPDYDFLAEGSLVVTNAVADEKGIVQIPREALGPFAVLRVVAVDPAATVMRWVWLPKEEAKFQDLRLARGLDPEKHYAQQKSISILNKDETLTVADITSSRVETFDTLAKVYRLLVTLTNDSNLVEFSFLANWPNLKPEEKKTLYSKYASHELSFFLFKKDPEFFNAVIKPYLANKKDKTFIDYWLLGEDLKEFSQVWKHGRLNVVETILLGRNLPGEGPFARRFVQDSFELLPPDRERKLRLFETAITTAALNLGDDFSDRIDEARLKQLSAESAPPSDAPMGYAAGLGGGGPAGSFGMAGGRFGGQMAGKPASNRGGVEADEKAKDVSRRMSRSRALAKSQSEEAKKEVESFDKRDAEAYYMDAVEDLAESGQAADGIVMERLAERKKMAQLYRKVDSTKEYAENNYHHLPIENQVASLVSVNAFWRDYAKHEADQPFFSDNFADASRNFTEAMFALSVLDVPFAASEHETTFDKAVMKLKAGSPMVVIHEEIKPTDVKADTAVLVGQNFFRANDRYRIVEGEQADKFVTEEFLVHTVYGCQVVVTNPSSSRQKLDVLLQIPLGAIPLNNGKQTKSMPVDLQPFATATLEYFFYFPAPGKFAHFPVHVSKQGQLVASATAFVFNVVAEASKIDRESWEYVSQNGTDAEVLAYLEANNVRRLDLDKIAFRMKDKAFFEKATAVLSARHTYNNTLWSYSLLHNTIETARQYLQYQDAFLSQCGAWISSPLVDIDPVIRHGYQHFEYKPLVNARAHKLGPNRQILNDRFNQQYHQLLYVLSFRRSLDDTDNMAVLYYLLLQDRIEEAQAFFQKINPERLSTRLQYDYCAAWLDLFNDEPKVARQIADKYADHPVDRWRNLFASVGQTLDEIEGKANYLVDKDNRDQQQTNLAANATTFDLKVESGQVSLNCQNLSNFQVHYYLMDIELLFSRNPFVQQQSGEFRSIRPNLSEYVTIDAADKTHSWPLPETLRNRNVLVEVSAAGQTKSQAYYANSLTAQVVENYGQVQVNHLGNGKPLPKTYVKVYARLNDGQVKFYKDGYTDLRGRFEYASLSTNELDNVDRFAILLMHDEHGAMVKEAAPPKR